MVDKYRQVVVKRPSGTGYYTDVWWIDNELARVGKAVLDEDGLVWVVTEAHGVRDRSTVEAWHGAYKRFKDVLSDH